MKPNSIVIISLHSPKEKFWGILEEITPAGITVRGVDLNAFAEWMSQVGTVEEMGLALVFYPMCRVERVALDESVGNIPSLAATFLTRSGMTVQEYLQKMT
jgi:hypothetical protein